MKPFFRRLNSVIHPGTFLVAAAFFLSYLCVAQTPPKSMFKQYSTRNGLLNNSIYSLEKGDNGLWWVATGDGLQRFDGYRFENWNQSEETANTKIFGANSVFEDGLGNVWVFNMERHFVFPAGSGKFIGVAADSLVRKTYGNFVLPAMEDSERVWGFSSNIGFFGFNKESLIADKFIPFDFNRVGEENLKPFPFIGVDNIGAVWISQDFEDSSYVLRFKPGEEVVMKSFPVNKFGKIKAFIPLENNRFLFLSSAYAAICSGFDIENPLKILTRENIPGNYIRGLPFETLKFNQKGHIIFPGEKGIYRFNPADEKLQIYLSSEYAGTNLSRQFMFALKEDNWGNIWIGRDASDGLLIYSPGKLKFRSYNAPEKYFNLVYSLAVSHNGKLFASNFQKGINVFNESGTWLKHIGLPPTENELVPSIRTMNFIGEKHLAMKSLYCRMFILNTHTLQLTDISNLVPEYVKAQKNVFDAVFVSTGENLLEFTHGSYILQLEKKDSKFVVSVIDTLNDSKSITSLIYVDGGKRMIGTGNGCYIKNDGKWNIIEGTENYYFKHLTTDNNGTVWAATNHGILLIKGESITAVYNIETGLLNEMIYGILFDDAGNAWYSSNRGLGCVQTNGMVKFFSETDGLQGDEFDTQSFWKSKDGRLYFGGTKGISSFTPEQALEDEKAGKIILAGLQVNGNNFPANKRVDEVNGLDLKHYLNSLAFSFTLSNFSDSEYNVYQVKMDGFDESWVNLGSVYSTRYHLMPGKYNFRVKGSSDGSNWSEEFVLPIIIRQAWWQNEWVKWGLGLAGILFLSFGIWIWYYRKTTKYRLQLNMQLEMQKERDRISRDLHDNIGAYSLALIANAEDIEESVNGSGASGKIDLLKDNARNILISIRETIWLLNSKNLTVSGFTEGFMNYCNNIIRNYEGIEIEFSETITENSTLSPLVAVNLMRIFQESFQNIIKHADASKILFSIESNGFLKIMLTDNGKGFDPGGKFSQSGLLNVKHRAAEIGFIVEIKSATPGGTGITVTGAV